MLPVVGRAAWTALVSGDVWLHDELQVVPGLYVDRNTVDGERVVFTVTTPWSGLPTVMRLARERQAGISWIREPKVHVPRPWGPEHAEELLDRLWAGGIKPGALALGGVLPGDSLMLEFQMEAVWFGLERGSALLKEAPGAGKTIQALSMGLAACRIGLSEWLPLLVVTGSSVVRQYKRNVDHLTITKGLELRAPSDAPVRRGVRMTSSEQIAEYLEDRRRQRLPPVVVVGWDSLVLHLEALLGNLWGAVVFDESQNAKTGKRQAWSRDAEGRLQAKWTRHRSSAAAQLAQAIPHRFPTTATPIFDRRGDIYGNVTLVEPWGWGKTPKRFLIRYAGGHQGEYGFEANEPINDEELAERLAMVIHNVPKAVSHAQLPPTRVEVRYIPVDRLDPEPAGFGRQVVLLGRQAKQGSLEAIAQLRELLLMVSSARKRTEVLRDVLDFVQSDREGSKGKVLVFTGRHEDCWHLAEKFKAALDGTIEVMCGVNRTAGVDGGRATYDLPSPTARDAMHKAYMAHPGPLVFVATGMAWGTGLDLQDTDLLAVVMLPPNPGPFIQWLGRVERLGQTRGCLIRLYVGEGTADTRLSDLFGEKAEDFVKLFGDRELAGISLKLKGVDDLATAISKVMDQLRSSWEAEDEDWSKWDVPG